MRFNKTNRYIVLICFLFATFICFGKDNKTKVDCTLCKGTGDNPNYCRICKGTGISYEPIPEMCRVCEGENPYCPICGGNKNRENRKVKVPCSACNGIPSFNCPNCKGTGKTLGVYSEEVKAVCPTCNGKGSVQEKCSVCGGTGKSVAISEYRMKHDIDYWVCKKCRGMKKMCIKCTDCNGTGTEDSYIETYKNRTIQFLNIKFMCDPVIHIPIYEHLGFVGNGTINGKLVFYNSLFTSCTQRISTPSNGWYNYIITSRKTNISYTDTLIGMKSSYMSYGTMIPNGAPSLTWNKEKQEVKQGINKTAVYKIKKGKVLSDQATIKYINDSTIIEECSDYLMTYIITPNHIRISSFSNEDMRNIEMWLDKGCPIRIKDYKGDRRYRYTKFDKNNNWVKREELDQKGNVIETFKRDIVYGNKKTNR